MSFIHWGGGTPSLLGPERLKTLWAALGARFDLSRIDEHAIELDPRTVDEALAQGLAAIGVNRVSFGVQDLNAHVQQAIGRVQPFEIVEHAVRLVRAAGISAVNLDLMYGLPEQTIDDVERTAHLAASLDPSRLAIFGYAHVPWFKVHQKLIDASALPAPPSASRRPPPRGRNWKAKAIAPSGSTTSRARQTRSPSPRAQGFCGAIFKGM